MYYISYCRDGTSGQSKTKVQSVSPKSHDQLPPKGTDVFAVVEIKGVPKAPLCIVTIDEERLVLPDCTEADHFEKWNRHFKKWETIPWPSGYLEYRETYTDALHAVERSKTEIKPKPVEALGLAPVEIFFNTGQSVLKSTTMLDTFVIQHQGGPVVIEGYCDNRGGADYNYRLGLRRATAVRNYLAHGFRRSGKEAPVMQVVSFGENKAQGAALAEMATDRKVVLVPADTSSADPIKGQVLKQGLDKIKGSVFLVDASGSMADVWHQILAYQFPKGSRQFSFTDCNGRTEVTEGIRERVGCENPLWDSMSIVLGKMFQGESLTVVTDGDDGQDIYGTTAVDGILATALSKKIRINFIQIGNNYGAFNNVIRRVAHTTNGKYYIRE